MKRVSLGISFVALLSAFFFASACDSSPINSPTNTAHGTQCFTDYDCMSTQHCQKSGSNLMGSCIDKTSGAAATTDVEGGAPTAPSGTIVDAGVLSYADGDVSL